MSVHRVISGRECTVLECFGNADALADVTIARKEEISIVRL